MRADDLSPKALFQAWQESLGIVLEQEADLCTNAGGGIGDCAFEKVGSRITLRGKWVGKLPKNYGVRLTAILFFFSEKYLRHP